jgi:AraC family transcriptional regulator
MAAELQSHANDAGELYRDALINLLMAHLTERYGEKRATAAANALDGARLERVREHIEAHLGDALSLATLSEIATMSTFHFARSFKAATGTPPHRYVTRRRMERARSMLLGTRLPVSDIGWRVGYPHTGNFVQAFKKVFGMTPGELRQQAD